MRQPAPGSSLGPRPTPCSSVHPRAGHEQRRDGTRHDAVPPLIRLHHSSDGRRPPRYTAVQPPSPSLASTILTATISLIAAGTFVGGPSVAGSFVSGSFASGSLAASARPGHAGATAPLVSTRIDTLVRGAMRAQHFSGAVLVRQGPRILLRKTYGLADLHRCSRQHALH